MPAALGDDGGTALDARAASGLPGGISARRARHGQVIAYIVRGDSLVAFTHENDQDPVLGSGLQVPAGTIHDGEEPADAVLREAFEETGLTGLRVARYLGQDEVTWPGSAPHIRHFFHVEADDAPDDWHHIERDEGTGFPRPFHLFWLKRSEAWLLSSAQGVLVWKLDAD
jgi:8-oxo-dGTP pyrophosphatase MutT (NUDIX family)